MASQSDYKLEDFEACGQPSVEKLSDAPWAVGGDSEAEEMVESCMSRRVMSYDSLVWDRSKKLDRDRYVSLRHVKFNGDMIISLR